MRFKDTSIEGLFLIQFDKVEDDRGIFMRSFCVEEFKKQGLRDHFTQHNISVNHRKGTLRGMHYQAAPREEAKIVRCTRGSIFDVILDVRAGSKTFGKWEGFTLSENDGQSLYIAEGLAHGFQTLTDNAEVFYLMSDNYVGELARGVLWNDPDAGIRWPLPVSVISDRDGKHPNLKQLKV